MWETIDPDGRRVVLAAEHWLHIVEEHGELAHSRAAVLTAVERPNRRMPGRQPGEAWFYLEGPGPTRFLKVVVHYAGGSGRIVTAFPRRRFP